MKNLSFCLVLTFIVLGKSLSFATNPINIQAHFIEKESDKITQKNGLLTKAKKWFDKKVAAVWDTEKARRMGLASLILGILSIGSWALLALTNGWILIAIVVFALAGDVLSIMTLWNTRTNKKENRTARGMAWFGLVFSLLTGLAPLALLGIILASL